MNILFFKAAMGVYLLSAAGYVTYLIKPEKKRVAAFSFWAAFAGFIIHLAYFSFRWVESGRIPATNFFEAANFLGLGIMLVFLIMEYRFRIAALGSFMLPLVIVLMVPAFIVTGKISRSSTLCSGAGGSAYIRASRCWGTRLLPSPLSFRSCTCSKSASSKPGAWGPFSTVCRRSTSWTPWGTRR